MPELAAALNSGSISAAPLSAPSSYVAEQRGNRVIANLAHEGISFVIAGLTTTRRFLREQRRDAKGFFARLRPCDAFYVRAGRPGKKYFTQICEDRRPWHARGSLKYAQDFTEKIPLVKREGVQVVLDQETAKSPPPKEFTPERFYDNSLVQELIHEGFYKSLWSK